ncbi:MAG: hypothetical protein M3Q29_17950 [Chloroflexota bacterium]|nr:hypothetical protein [Chloroflexota bacterium]
MSDASGSDQLALVPPPRGTVPAVAEIAIPITEMGAAERGPALPREPKGCATNLNVR